jgi:DNA-binding transcriptional MerR regulator
MKRQFTTNDVIALTGLTGRQLQWWDERGLVTPNRQGHRRVYTWDQLVTAAVIGQLRRRGFSLQRVRKVVAFLGREFGTSLAATVRAASEYHLLSDGTHLYLRTSARQVVDLLKNSAQPMFDICLSDEVRRVRARIDRGEKAQGKTVSQKKRAASELIGLRRARQA